MLSEYFCLVFTAHFISLDESEAMYTRAVDGREAILGPEHADTLDSITCLALVLQNLGKDAEAEAMYLRAMDASGTVVFVV
jgi:hypothetical protein